MRQTCLKSVIAIATAVIVAACGKTMPSPAGPSASASTSAPAPSGATGTATISGSVIGAPATGAFRTMSAASIVVTVVGSSVTATVDGSGRFTLQNVPSGDQTLVFSGTGISARVTISGVADHEHIDISVALSGAAAAVDEDEREEADRRAEVEGRLTSVNAAARTFVVRGVTVSVPAGTPVHHGDTAVALTALVVGERVHVHGTMTAPNAVTATDVEVQNEHADPGDGDGRGDDGHDGAEAEIEGTLSGLTGACPAVTFMVSSTTVVTNASTKYEDTTCATLAGAGRVEVKGTKQSNGSVLAAKVEKK